MEDLKELASKQRESSTKGYRGQLLIGIGAVIWGTQGIFAKMLLIAGLSALQIAAVKLLLGSFTLFGIMAVLKPKALTIDKTGLGLTLLLGLLCQAGFNGFYYSSVNLIGVSCAAVILYTSPVFFLGFSVVFFKEKLSLKKALSAGLCILGCGLAVTGGNLNLEGLSVPGMGLALLSALSFALMGAISKGALTRYEPLAITAYSFLFGGLILLPFSFITAKGGLMLSPSIVWGSLGIGLLPAALSYYLYYTGVKIGVPLSQAGVISALEMVSAVVLAAILLGEELSLLKILGLMVILISVILSEVGGDKKCADGV